MYLFDQFSTLEINNAAVQLDDETMLPKRQHFMAKQTKTEGHRFE